MKIYHSLLDSLQMLLSKFLLKIPHFRLLDERCDSLYEQVQGLESDLQIKETHLISLKHSLDDSERRNQEITGANKHNVSLCISLENTIWELKNQLENSQKDLTKQNAEYNLIEFPSMVLAEIESRLKLADKSTIQVIVEYLKTDSAALVENLAKVTNSSNASNLIAYRDGALGRNKALIEKLQTIKSLESFPNRISWEMNNRGQRGQEQKD